ncbi:hypothetical protein BASA60_000637 [Batrachochytrium salamandrivorans]|nr:hypothetical protein BASA60_000637 [Batrachochytrium salamandrivorans]
MTDYNSITRPYSDLPTRFKYRRCQGMRTTVSKQRRFSEADDTSCNTLVLSRSVLLIADLEAISKDLTQMEQSKKKKRLFEFRSQLKPVATTTVCSPTAWSCG